MKGYNILSKLILVILSELILHSQLASATILKQPITEINFQLPAEMQWGTMWSIENASLTFFNNVTNVSEASELKSETTEENQTTIVEMNTEETIPTIIAASYEFIAKKLIMPVDHFMEPDNEFIKISEPSVLALFCFSLIALQLARRRKIE